MMDFVILVAAFVVAQLLTMVIAFAVILNKRVLKWYYKKSMKMIEGITEAMVELEDKEL